MNTKDLALYQFDYCPYCVRVRRVIEGLGIKIEIRDTMRDPSHKQDLLEGGGMTQVPCLRIETENGVEWMYESSDIIQYLETRFG